MPRSVASRLEAVFDQLRTLAAWRALWTQIPRDSLCGVELYGFIRAIGAKLSRGGKFDTQGEDHPDGKSRG